MKSQRRNPVALVLAVGPLVIHLCFLSRTLPFAHQPSLTQGGNCHSRGGGKVRSGCNPAHGQDLVTVTSGAVRRE